MPGFWLLLPPAKACNAPNANASPSVVPERAEGVVERARGVEDQAAVLWLLAVAAAGEGERMVSVQAAPGGAGRGVSLNMSQAGLARSCARSRKIDFVVSGTERESDWATAHVVAPRAAPPALAG